MSVVEDLVRKDAPRPKKAELTDTHIGQLLCRAGKLSEDDVARVVVSQRRNAMRFGDAALSMGLVQPSDIEQALATQFEYVYLRQRPAGFSPALVAAFEPESPQAEALRTLRTQLMLRCFQDRKVVLAVVASRAEEGCSEVAANLAILFAQLGERTLLIDANMRSPIQHRLFGISSDHGLSTLLSGRGSFKQAPAAIAPFTFLSILCAGVVPPNPQELLSRIGFSYIAETAPAAFDIVIYDTPPVLDYADAQLIAARAGACLLVARRHKTTVADIESTRHVLESAGSSLLGTVISD